MRGANSWLRMLDRIWIDETRWLARTAPYLRCGDVQFVEAADTGRHGGNLGACEGKPSDGVVFQQLLPMAGHVVLCSDYRSLVLVHRSIYSATRPRCRRRDQRQTRQ